MCCQPTGIAGLIFVSMPQHFASALGLWPHPSLTCPWQAQTGGKSPNIKILKNVKQNSFSAIYFCLLSTTAVGEVHKSEQQSRWIMQTHGQFLLPLTRLQGLQSPTESEREVFLIWKCLKLFRHLLTYFHKSQLEGGRTTKLRTKTYTLESKNWWGLYF